MLHAFLLSIVCLQASSGSSPQEKEAPRIPIALPESYAHPFLGMKIRLPAQWARGPSQSKAACSFYGPKDLDDQPRIDLFVNLESRDAASVCEQYRIAFLKAFPNAEVQPDEALTVQGHPARRFTASFKKEGVALKSMWSFVVAEGRVFVLSFNCADSSFDRYFRLIDASVKSLRIFPIPELSPEARTSFNEHYERGEKAYREKKFSNALTSFQSAAEILPDWADLYSAIGTVQMRLKKHGDAAASYRKARDRDPKDPSYPFNLGLALLQVGQASEAIEALSKAVELDPESEPARTNLGVAQIARDDLEPARSTLEKSIELNPESILAHYHLGTVYEKLGQRDLAERQFKDTLALDPKHAKAAEALRRLKKK